MLQKLENQPIMPVTEMQVMFPDNWFRYVIDREGKPRAFYIANSRDELLTISVAEMYQAGYMEWGDAEGENLVPTEPIEIGGLRFEWTVDD